MPNFGVIEYDGQWIIELQANVGNAGLEDVKNPDQRLGLLLLLPFLLKKKRKKRKKPD